MADLLFDSIELESNAHPDDYHYTISGNKGSKKIVVITPSEKKIIKPDNIPVLHKEPKATKG